MLVRDADYVKAKKFANLARKQNVPLYNDVALNNGLYEVIDHCYEAGPPEIPFSDGPTQKEIKAFKSSKID